MDALELREQLAEARGRGLSFDEAWRQALRNRYIDVDTRIVLQATRASWKRAYLGHKQTAGERAVLGLVEFVGGFDDEHRDRLPIAAA